MAESETTPFERFGGQVRELHKQLGAAALGGGEAELTRTLLYTASALAANLHALLFAVEQLERDLD